MSPENEASVDASNPEPRRKYRVMADYQAANFSPVRRVCERSTSTVLVIRVIPVASQSVPTARTTRARSGIHVKVTSQSLPMSLGEFSNTNPPPSSQMSGTIVRRAWPTMAGTP